MGVIFDELPCELVESQLARSSSLTFFSRAGLFVTPFILRRGLWLIVGHGSARHPSDAGRLFLGFCVAHGRPPTRMDPSLYGGFGMVGFSSHTVSIVPKHIADRSNEAASTNSSSTLY